VNSVPGAQISNEDTALAFSLANGNAISVSDADGNLATTRLSVSNGTIRVTLDSTGATITSGTNGTSTLTLSGKDSSNDFEVSNLIGDLVASGTSGSLDVTTGDNTVDNSIGITSYDGRVFVAINADFDSVPDLPDLVDGLGEALEELKQAVKALGGRRGRAAKPAKRSAGSGTRLGQRSP
jgi:hypothetical protein